MKKTYFLIIFIVIITSYQIYNNYNAGAFKGQSYDNNIALDIPHAKKPIIISLRDGESYDMSADFVQQEIGGKILKRLAYNEMIPGPIFQVPQWAKITLNFTNNIDEETTIHSHGLRGDYTMDGTPGIPHPSVKPGETFRYELEFPDAGVFWYHPHVREDRQQDGWLYGNYLVQPESEDYWTQDLPEESWILDDLSLSEYFQDTTTHALTWRFGDIQMINNEEKFSTTATAWQTVRYFITNSANVRPFRITIDGAQTKIVWGDIGRIEREILAPAQWITIAPAERYILEVYYPEPWEYSIQNSTPEFTHELWKVLVTEKSQNDSLSDFQTLRDNSDDFWAIRSQIQGLAEWRADKRLRVAVDIQWGKSHAHHAHGDAQTISWKDDQKDKNSHFTNKNVVWKLVDQDSGKVNQDIDWQFELWEQVVIEIDNDKHADHPMQHPIHFHGQRFVVIERDGVINDNLQWKDTVLLETGEKIKILLDNTNPWIWMAHCHISEHLHAGMLFHFTVWDHDLPTQKHSH